MKTRVVRDLIGIVFAQLPVGIRDSLVVDVDTDAFFLAPKAVITDKQGRKWTVELENAVMQDTGIELRWKLPETFVAKLCMVV